jgi:hypothetical protein
MASACAEFTGRFDCTSDDFEGFGCALGLLSWRDESMRRKWGMTPESLIIKVAGRKPVKGTEDAAAENAMEWTMPTNGYGLHKVTVESTTSHSDVSQVYPLGLLRQISAAIILNKDPGREVIVCGFGQWNASGKQEMRKLVSIRE